MAAEKRLLSGSLKRRLERAIRAKKQKKRRDWLASVYYVGTERYRTI